MVPLILVLPLALLVTLIVFPFVLLFDLFALLFGCFFRGIRFVIISFEILWAFRGTEIRVHSRKHDFSVSVR